MQDTNQKQNITALTGLRGFAALWVLILHACFGNVNDYGYFSAFDSKINFGIAENFILKGFLAVDLFFILSGFILSHNYQDQFNKNIKLNDLKQFYIRRLARIYPIHLIVTVVLCILFFSSLWQPIRPLSLNDMTLSILLLNVWSDPSVNIPAWSVSAEWFAYLLCPFVFIILAKIKKKFLIAFMILGICIIYPLLFHALFCCNGLYGGGAILRVMSGFVGGVLLYNLFKFPHNKNSKIFDMVGLGSIVAIFSLSLLNVHFSVLYPLLFVFIYALSRSKTFLYKVFSSKIMIFLGLISYCIYMLHYLVLEIFSLIFSDYLYANSDNNQIIYWIILTSIVAVTILLSWIFYRFIENPARNFINKKF